MTFTFTTLFEVSLQDSARTQQDRLDDYSLLKLALSKCGFIGSESNAQQHDDHQKRGEEFSEFFHHRDRSLTLFMSCDGGDCITLDLNERSSSATLDNHNKFSELLRVELSSKLPAYEVRRVPTIVRGREIWQYCELGDGRIVENRFQEILFDERSPFQRVTIAQAPNGNVLLLDWLENLSEEDDTYTISLCGLERGVDYQDKTVLILGGGDGGALECLRKLHPRMVTMIEIDEVVMRACRTHLRKCCGDSLDNYEGENYKIIVGDCLDYLEQYVREGRKFDYIISDITDIPIEADAKVETNSETKGTWNSPNVGWGFFKTVFNRCLALLQDDGIIMTHVTGSSNVEKIGSFKATLDALDHNVTYELFRTYVPSFEERWEFCHVRKSTA